MKESSLGINAVSYNGFLYSSPQLKLFYRRSHTEDPLCRGPQQRFLYIGCPSWGGSRDGTQVASARKHFERTRARPPDFLILYFLRQLQVFHIFFILYKARQPATCPNPWIWGPKLVFIFLVSKDLKSIKKH